MSRKKSCSEHRDSFQGQFYPVKPPWNAKIAFFRCTEHASRPIRRGMGILPMSANVGRIGNERIAKRWIAVSVILSEAKDPDRNRQVAGESRDPSLRSG
jgi:hypothetical protein